MRIIAILLRICPLLTFGQANEAINEKVNKLNGTWMLERYERDSLERPQEILNRTFVEKTFIKNHLTKKEESESGYVMEFSFDFNGQSFQQEYFEYRPKKHEDDWIEINTDSPFLEFKIKNDEVYIHMT